jgi:hypothetical protein
MSAAQRLSRGFHRLGLFLAAVPMLIGGAIAINGAMEEANNHSREHQKVLCAHEYLLSQEAAQKDAATVPPDGGGALAAFVRKYGLPTPESGLSPDSASSGHGLPKAPKSEPGQAPAKGGLLESIGKFLHPPDDAKLGLKEIGCSGWEYDSISYGEARNPPKFEWLNAFGRPAAVGLAITLAVTLGVYGLVRAIGWVIGGFASS